MDFGFEIPLMPLSSTKLAPLSFEAKLFFFAISLIMLSNLSSYFSIVLS